MATISTATTNKNTAKALPRFKTENFSNKIMAMARAARRNPRLNAVSIDLEIHTPIKVNVPMREKNNVTKNNIRINELLVYGSAPNKIARKENSENIVKTSNNTMFIV